MTLRLLGRLFVVPLLLALVPAIAFAQEAVLSGTVTDASGAVLPGVAITAVHQATGNKFAAVTDERGVYRIAARAGVYRLTAELQGFRAVTREGLELLVGQVMTVNLPMLEATAAETVTVTAESPLLNVATSSLGGNVDSRQVEELPVNGRNWMNLATLAPGSRTVAVNATTPLPDRNGGEAREFQLNMDGQQVSADIGTGGQPRYSQDSIAEFQFVSNRFDATQGRSSGVQVNAITKSGGNRLTGSFRGNFRNSKFNAFNPVLSRVEPIDNQQLSSTLGGPLVKDKLHFFVNYEYEREPRTSIWNTPYPEFNVDLDGTNSKNLGGVRFDYQLSSQTRLMGKVSVGASLGTVRGRQPAASRRDEYDVRTQQRGARPTHAGAEQSRAERGEGRLRVLQPREPQPDELGQPLAERQRHHHRISAYYVRGLFDRGQPVPPAAPGPGRLERPRRLHVLGTMLPAVTTCAPVASSCAVIRFRQTAGNAWGRSLPTSAVLAPAFPDRWSRLRSRCCFPMPSTPTRGTWQRFRRS